MKNKYQDLSKYQIKSKTSESHTFMKKVRSIAKGGFKSYVVFALIVQTILIGNMVSVGVWQDPDRILTFGSFYAFIADMGVALSPESELSTLKDVSDELVRGCSDDLCKLKKIFYHLEENFEYESGTNLNAGEIWAEKKGDCDEITNLLLTMLKTQGIKGDFICTMNHCYAVVKIEGRKIRADTVQFQFLHYYSPDEIIYPDGYDPLIIKVPN